MNEEEPPDLTIVIYKTLTGQYYPVVIGNNGEVNDKLKDFFKVHICGMYKVKPIYKKDFEKLCEDSFEKRECDVQRRIEKLLTRN